MRVRSPRAVCSLLSAFMAPDASIAWVRSLRAGCELDSVLRDCISTYAVALRHQQAIWMMRTQAMLNMVPKKHVTWQEACRLLQEGRPVDYFPAFTVFHPLPPPSVVLSGGNVRDTLHFTGVAMHPPVKVTCAIAWSYAFGL